MYRREEFALYKIVFERIDLEFLKRNSYQHTESRKSHGRELSDQGWHRDKPSRQND